jgi:DNA-binding transcriptional regulator YiaG
MLTRFLLLLRVLGAKYLTEDLRRDLGIPNKMVLSNWRTGRRQPTPEDMGRVSLWAEAKLSKPGLWAWVQTGKGGHQTELEAVLQLSPLAKLREEHGLSQYDAAKLIGISRATLITWEKTFTLAEGDAWERASAAYEGRPVRDVSLGLVRELRARTLSSVVQCRAALVACGEDVDKAEQWIQARRRAKQ